MIITRDVLVSYNACKPKLDRFCELYPDGLDVSSLWGTLEEQEATWKRLLSDEFLRQHIGWAMGEGLIPSRIVGDFAKMDLAGAYLRLADLRGANLGYADLRGTNLRWADLRGADLRWADLHGADLHWAILTVADLRLAKLHETDLTGASLLGADLRDAIISNEQREYAIKRGAIC